MGRDRQRRSHVALTNARIDLPDGEHLVVHAWPDDPSWGRVTDLLSTGLPELVEKTGLAWPVQGDLDVFEVHTPLLEGYAGDLLRGREPDRDQRGPRRPDDPPRGVARLVQRRPVRRTLDQRGLRRHLSRRGRSTRSASAAGRRTRSTRPTAAAVRLNDWTFPGRIADDQTDAREALRLRRGVDGRRARSRPSSAPDRMRTVLAAAEARQIAYVGAGTPEPVTGEHGLAAAARPARRAWWVADGGRRLPALGRQRRPARPTSTPTASARTAYAGLVDAGGDWLPPMYVRDAMAGWRFDEAASPDRHRARRPRAARRARPGRVAAGSGRRRPTCGLRTRRRRPPWPRAKSLATREISDGQAQVAAATAVSCAARPVQTIGLLGSTTPEARLATIRAAFSRARRDDGDRRGGPVRDAGGCGRRRAQRIFVVALILVIAIVDVVATILIAAHRRQVRRPSIRRERTRRQRPGSGSPAWPRRRCPPGRCCRSAR